MRELRVAEEEVGDALQHRVVRAVARSGYVASGLLRSAIGLLALLLAVRGGGTRADASGAFAAVAAVPGGVLLLGLVAAADLALTLWLVARGILHRDRRHPLQRWRQRLVYWGRAVAYAVIGGLALRFALGAHHDSTASDRQASRHLLDVPGGALVLGLIGALIVVTGASMAWIGVRRRFVRTIHLPDDRGPRLVVLWLGAVGYAVQGATIAVVGGFVLLAAFTLDPTDSSGLDGTLGAFAGSPVGRAFLVAVGVGWIVAGVYAVLRARIGRIGG